MSPELLTLVVLPVALGLLGFVEPCSLGATLVFVKFLEGKSPVAKVWQTATFALTRAVWIGLLGLAAAAVGRAFLGFQHGVWLVLGVVYLALGAVYVTNNAGFLMRTLGPSLRRLSGLRGSAVLGVLFGFNVPACAAPLVFVLLGASAAGGALGTGFMALGLFGLALSAPLVLAVLLPRVQQWLERLAGLSRRIPVGVGVVLLALGVWSLYFGLAVELEQWAMPEWYGDPGASP